jgi:hypothetical protein
VGNAVTFKARLRVSDSNKLDHEILLIIVALMRIVTFRSQFRDKLSIWRCAICIPADSIPATARRDSFAGGYGDRPASRQVRRTETRKLMLRFRVIAEKYLNFYE